MFNSWIQQLDPVFVVWFSLMIVTLVIELITINLASIWFTVGAFGALITFFLGGSLPIQIISFLVISFLLLLTVRPFARGIINAHTQCTNADSLIGKEIILSQTIDAENQVGREIVNGLEWSIRSNNGVPINAGQKVQVVGIEGVKLMVQSI